MPRLSSLLIPAAMALAILPAKAQQAPPDPLQQAIASIKRTLEQRPADPTLYYYLASFQARAKERDNAIASLKKVLELGEGFLPGEHFGFENLRDDAEYRNLRAKILAGLPVVADAPVAFRLADKAFAPEGIAWDPVGKSFYVGSITRKRIVRISPTGKLQAFSREADGLHQILGVSIDAKRRMLYAVSTSALTNPAAPENAIVAYHLDSAKRVAEHRVPQAQQLNDVVAAPNGDLYATDSRAGGVWRIEAGKAPVPFIAAGTLGGSNGLALSPDGKALYVAHSTGIVRIDTATATYEKLAPPARQTLAAVDGLYYRDGDLIGIQSITNPGRVIRIRLNKEGGGIDRVDTLQSHHNPAFVQPTTGAVVGDAIYVLGTTQLPQYNGKGELQPMKALKEPAVVRVPLGKG